MKTMMKKALLGLTLAASAALPTVAAADSYYESPGEFAMALLGQYTPQDFSGPYTQNAAGTSWTWGDVTFSCTPVAYCGSGNPYFTGGPIDHFNFVQGHFVYFANPDVATFTFATPIRSFGLHVFGNGQVSGPNGLIPSPMTVTYADGTHDFFPGYVTNWNISQPLFAGIVFDKPVTSVQINGAVEGNGLFFANLVYTPVPVPEPSTLLLMGAGLGLVALRRRRQA